MTAQRIAGEQEVDQELAVIPIDRLVGHPSNPRRDLGDLTELTESIKGVGIVEPLVVNAPLNPGGPAGKPNTSYVVVAGHRRLVAATAAGLKAVPCLVRKLSPALIAEIMLVENLQRRDLDPLEEAQAYHRLINELGRTQRDLAAKVGRSQAHISKRLALLELPDEAKTALDAGGITIAEALELTKLIGEPKRLRKVLNASQNYGGVARAIRWELDEIERRKAVEERMAAVRASGVRVVEWPAGGWVKSSGTCPVGWLGLPFDELEAHKDLPCHAVAIPPGDFRMPVDVCTDALSHGSAGSAAVSSGNGWEPSQEELARREADRIRREERLATAGRRQQFIKALVAKPLPKRDLVDVGAVIARAMLGAEFFHGEEACTWLGLDVNDDMDDSLEVLLAWGKDDPEKALRAALAVWLADNEQALTQSWVRDWAELARPHLEFLAARGYVLTETERAELEPPAAPDDLTAEASA